MTFSYFITGHNRRDPGARLSTGQHQALAECIAHTPELACAEIGVPAEVQTYHGDVPLPALALRLDFATLPALEHALAEGGALQRLAVSALWAGLPLDDVTQQAMLRRCFLDLGFGTGSGCDYLVHYPGQAEDFNAWLRHYLGHHPPIMTSYPDVRGVDVFTRVDWCDAMPWRRVAYMQRNRIAFDSPQQLLAALASQVRARMRADHDRFPPYSDGSRHYAMRVMRVGA
ncbi:ethyl tert-butyl ether degradation protein EthD [Aquabacterium sp.]|uniref:ethyl tert-butyl ether degradation protein EthD n=1 Tax=Aquabacterium sp. TaxID=1872578 RepID=UPI002BFBDAEB|nr:ethyl tert-butyl ether degradation protein EthD [Aquabacterium sp.]HSW04675.1 ethyl tert-butyl ether degradation protein EthD [Aquabacterium sp.]